MKIYYVTLVKALSGYYLVFSAPSNNAVRYYCAKNLGTIWFSVYTSKDKITETRIGRTIYLNENGEVE